MMLHVLHIYPALSRVLGKNVMLYQDVDVAFSLHSQFKVR